MKKTILFIMAMILAFGAAATDRFYIEDFTINPGETITVSIQLDNEVSYTAFQSDLFMPEGLTATNFALTDRKNSNHTFTATILPDGGIRLLSYSLKLKTYSDNSGALVTFDVTSSEDFEGDASIRLTGTIFTTEAGLEVPFDDENCTVSLSATGIRGDQRRYLPHRLPLERLLELNFQHSPDISLMLKNCECEGFFYSWNK